MSELDWDDLRYFLAAARAKTLAGAARALGVEHTTVGRRLSALERALGGALVLRGSDGLQLTRLGARIAPQLEELERNVMRIRELAQSEATRVRLAVPSGFTRYFTQDLPQLVREHPGLALELVSGSSVVDLPRGEADIALRSSPLTDPELVARKLCDAGFALYGSLDAASLEDLRGRNVIGFHENLANTPAARWLSAHGAGATVVLRSRELSDMVTAAIDGVGLAVLPCSLADGEPRLLRLSDVLVRAPLLLVHRREARLSEPVRVVIAFASAVIKRHAARIAGVDVQH
ncbi:MAG TPA: LysR family transcriptional regulator [Polyangiales bacterium]|nr:LysR family transcriptional regulator [Polyangiales bacterium]